MVNAADAFLRGFEKPLILWLLANEPKNGYALMKEVKTLTGRALKPSVVYPFLYWLEEKGFVVGDSVKKGRREFRFYRLTDKGKNLFMKIRALFSNPLRGMIADLLGEHEENGKL